MIGKMIVAKTRVTARMIVVRTRTAARMRASSVRINVIVSKNRFSLAPEKDKFGNGCGD
jgi:hypothetical protein